MKESRARGKGDVFGIITPHLILRSTDTVLRFVENDGKNANNCSNDTIDCEGCGGSNEGLSGLTLAMQVCCKNNGCLLCEDDKFF